MNIQADRYDYFLAAEDLSVKVVAHDEGGATLELVASGEQRTKQKLAPGQDVELHISRKVQHDKKGVGAGTRLNI